MFMILNVLAAVAAASPQTTPADTTDKDPVICEGREASEVGTHIKAKRTCLRKSQWEYVRNDTKRELRSINDRGSIPTPPSGR
ncbi:hypothetical protein [Sphingomonas sp.]|uniref:hypothetical protein n=1 Tax=Sphingomonas sp. TaxID=28214 RepID=UPI00286BCA9E|nr:hypothetical protein [Sphingomonas sp.]